MYWIWVLGVGSLCVAPVLWAGPGPALEEAHPGRNGRYYCLLSLSVCGCFLVLWKYSSYNIMSYNIIWSNLRAGSHSPFLRCPDVRHREGGDLLSSLLLLLLSLLLVVVVLVVVVVVVVVVAVVVVVGGGEPGRGAARPRCHGARRRPVPFSCAFVAYCLLWV